MNKLSIYTAVLCCLATPIPCAAYADSSEPSATAEVIRMDSWRVTQEMANNAKVSLAEAFAIAKKEAWNRRGRHAHFRHVFSKEGRYFFLDTFDMDKIHGVMPTLQELGVYVDSETGRAEYVQSKREFPPPDSKSEYFKNPLNKQLQFLESQYNKQRKENEKSASAAEEIAVQKVSTGNTARNIQKIAKDKEAVLKPKYQKAVDEVLREGLQEGEPCSEDLDWVLESSSPATKHLLRVLENNECDLGDGQSILRNGIIQDLCHDLDVLLQQDEPAPEVLDHAIWMASKLWMKNVVRFLELIGAPAGKYELGN